MTRRSVPVLLLLAIAVSGMLSGVVWAAGGEAAWLRLQAGQVVGLGMGGQTIAGQGLGGFYARIYRLTTGPDLLPQGGVEGLSASLPEGFSVDTEVTWQGKPTLAIKLGSGEPSSSGEIEFQVNQIEAHHTYLLRFAHRGRRLGGEFPPIIHIRQLDEEGEWAAPQLNLDLLNGTYDWQEQVVAIQAVENASRFAVMLHHPLGVGDFWMSAPVLQEVKQEPARPVVGRWEGQAEPRFTGAIVGTPISVEARALPVGQGIKLETTLSAPSAWLRSNPTALILSFRLPLAAVGWRWGDYLRQERRIEPGRTYSRYHLVGRRQFREVSTFPMAAVAGPEHGVALMVPLKPTLLTRLCYDAAGYLCAEFDLGLADRGGGAREEVGFSFDIVPFEPRWGWRSALAAYYARYPALFASAAEEGGWWIGPSERIKDLGDFGLQYSEQHFAKADRTKAEDEVGIYTCSYSEPWMWRILVSEERDVTQAQPLAAYLPEIERDADAAPEVMDAHDYWPAPRRESVRAFLNSVIFGPDGKYQVNAVRTYAGTFMEMSTSCLPGIRSKRWGDLNRGLLSYRYETLEDARRCAAGGAKMDGVYFDSVGDWSDISAEDHRSEHFAFASYPLTFSYATGRPIVSGLAAMAEYMEFVRKKGHVTMANSDSQYAAYAAPFLDMIGAGENFSDEAGSDEALSHDRSVAYRKSVSFGNSGMLSVSPEEAEARFRLLLFYHVYPGIFCGDPADLERARPVYQRYVPLMREMGRAGWEPIPWAVLDDRTLWLERYGPGRGRAAYFAVRNPTDAARVTDLEIDVARLGWNPADQVTATEVLSGDDLSVRSADGAASVLVEVPAHDTAVIRLTWPE